MLDPRDWDDFRRWAHRALDETLDAMGEATRGPAWRPVPDAVKTALRAPLPRAGAALEDVYRDFARLVRPYPTGNAHPRFFGWVHGGGTPLGALAELFAAAMNANVGGREHAAVYVERAVVGWFAELFGFPAPASGILTTGTSMGNLLAVVAAREAAGAAGGLVAYATPGAHDSVAKALRIAGLGDALRLVEPAALGARIAADRAAGLRPFLVVATAGTVGTGAFDPLDALADVCAAERLWLHVDGAFGAFAILSARHRRLVAGIERADSLAFDAHKWLQAPYAVGCVLFRDAEAHRGAFATSPAYLARAARGAAAGAPWYADFGLELSREFRALKLWLTLRHFGFDAMGAVVERTCALAETLASRIAAAPDLELLAPVTLNVVVFRPRRPELDQEALDRLVEETAIAVQESGAAVLSTASAAGRRALRACFVNHRTTEADLDVLLDAVEKEAARLAPRARNHG